MKDKNKLFLEDRLEEQFRSDGFVVIKNFLPISNVKEAIELYNSTHATIPNVGMWHTTFESSITMKQQIALNLELICKESIKKYFIEDCIGQGYFMIKNSGQDSASKPHQDPSFIDYNIYNSGTVWIPLVDVNSENGNMYAWKGSHNKLTEPIAYFQPQQIENDYEKIKLECTQFYMNAGDALFFNHRVVHGSHPNITDSIRPVIAYGIYPKEAQLFYPYLKKKLFGKEIRFYKINKDFFSTHDYKTEPTHLELCKVVKV